MKQSKMMILGIVIVLVALAGAVVLTGGGQNLQKGAAFDTSTIQVLPSSKITAAVGDNFTAEVWYYTSGNSKVDGVQTEVCYGNGVTLASVAVNTAAGFNSGPIVVTRTLSTGACSTVVVTSSQAAANLLTTGRAFTLNFTGVTAGTGNISLDSSTSQMTGDNPASATDKNITVTGVTGTSYEITGVRKDMCKSASISAVNPATTDNVTMSSSVKDGMTADHFTYAVYNLDNLYNPNNPKPVCVTTGGDSTNVGDCPAGTHQLVFIDPNTAIRQSGTRTVPYSYLFVTDVNNGNKPLIHAQILAYFQLGSGAVSLPEPTCVVFTNAAASTERQDMCKSASISAVNPATTDNVTMSSSVKDGMTADYFQYTVYNLDNLYSVNNPKPVCVATGGDVSGETSQCPAGTHALSFVDPDRSVKQTGSRTVPYSSIFVADANNANKPLVHAQILAYFQLRGGPFSLPEPSCVVFTNAVTLIPTPTVISEGLVLKFKMTFLGIGSSAKCADPAKMPLTLIVRAADGTVKAFNNVIVTKLSGSVVVNEMSLGVYQVSLRLGDFNYNNNLAVFIKDARHLQVKYGVDGQADFYNKAGGELGGLTTDEATTKVFDFTKYPLLAGDVVGHNGAPQDGVVDGVDFSYVKTQSIARTEVAAGGYMLADLNGNCKMESQDLSLLMLSLSERQGQLY